MRTNRILDALLPPVRQEILAATLLQPDRRWYLGALAKHLGTRASSLQRDLERLSRAGILRCERDGNRVYYSANDSCPVFQELRGLLIKTAGLADRIREAIEGVTGTITIAFIYGSIAAGAEGSESDVDVMIIGDAKLIEVAAALRPVEHVIGRPINICIYTCDEFRRKVGEGHHFLRSVLAAPRVFLIGTEGELVVATETGS